jgi:hypothetical protein
MESTKSKIIKYLSVVIVLGLVVLFVGLPLMIRVFGPPSMGTGSYEHARLWRDKPVICSSPNEVRQQFNCGSYRVGPDGSYTYVADRNTPGDGHANALLYAFPNGDWLAIAYASSHNTWGGGTVVTRDHTGRMRVFFGHVCGKPFVEGTSLEGVYACLEDPVWQEVSLEE